MLYNFEFAYCISQNLTDQYSIVSFNVIIWPPPVFITMFMYRIHIERQVPIHSCFLNLFFPFISYQEMPEEIEEEYHTDSEEENLEVEQLFQGLFAPLICWFAQNHWSINYFLIRKGANNAIGYILCFTPIVKIYQTFEMTTLLLLHFTNSMDRATCSILQELFQSKMCPKQLKPISNIHLWIV